MNAAHFYIVKVTVCNSSPHCFCLKCSRLDFILSIYFSFLCGVLKTVSQPKLAGLPWAASWQVLLLCVHFGFQRAFYRLTKQLLLHASLLTWKMITAFPANLSFPLEMTVLTG